LGREGLSETQRSGLRRMMLTDVERLSVFVDDILQASRIAHGRRSQTWTVVDVVQLARTSVDSIRKRYELTDGVITLQAPARLETFSDPTALEIILKNVIDNAVKYSGSSPQVEVRISSTPDGKLCIGVRDNGIGIERN